MLDAFKNADDEPLEQMPDYEQFVAGKDLYFYDLIFVSFILPYPVI